MREVPSMPVEGGGSGMRGVPVPAVEASPVEAKPELADAAAAGEQQVVSAQGGPGVAAQLEGFNRRVERGAAAMAGTGWEKVKDLGPIGRAIDRLKMWVSPKITEMIDDRMNLAGSRQAQAALRAEEYKIAADHAESQLAESEARLAILGTGVSAGALEQLRKEIEMNRERQRKFEEKARSRGERLEVIKTEQSRHEEKVNTAVRRLNQPLELKQAANQKEIDFLQVIEAKLMAQLKAVEAEYQALQQQNEAKAEEWRKQKRGSVKTALEQETRLLGGKAQLRADQILRLERQLDTTRLRLFELNATNRKLEKGKHTLLGVPKGETTKEEKLKPPVLFHSRGSRRVAME